METEARTATAVNMSNLSSSQACPSILSPRWAILSSCSWPATQETLCRTPTPRHLSHQLVHSSHLHPFLERLLSSFMVSTELSLFVLYPSQGSFRLTQLLSSFPKVGRPCKSLHSSISSRRVASRHFRLPSLLTSKGTSISLCPCVPVAGKQHELHFPTPTPTHQTESFPRLLTQEATTNNLRQTQLWPHLPPSSFIFSSTHIATINQLINHHKLPSSSTFSSNASRQINSTHPHLFRFPLRAKKPFVFFFSCSSSTTGPAVLNRVEPFHQFQQVLPPPSLISIQTH